MKHVGTLLAAACICPGLAGCITHAPEAERSPRIEPVLRVTHTAETASGWYQLGRYYQGQNRLELAEQAYRRALAVDIAFVDAHSALGAVYANQGKFNEAIAEFTAVLDAAPRLAQAYNNLGYTHYLRGDYEKAITFFDKAIALEPDNRRALNNLGAAHAKLGHADLAQAALMRSAGIDTTASRQADAAPVSGGNESSPVQITATPAQAAPSPRAEARMIANKPFRFQIANGNGVPGLAKRFRDALAEEGLPVSRLANLKPYRQQRTVVQYRAGFRGEALLVSARFATPPEVLEAAPGLPATTDVRLVLGHDTGSYSALHKTSLDIALAED